MGVESEGGGGGGGEENEEFCPSYIAQYIYDGEDLGRYKALLCFVIVYCWEHTNTLIYTWIFYYDDITQLHILQHCLIV